MSAPDQQPAVADATVLICSRGRPEMLLDVAQSVLSGATIPRELLVVDQSAARHESLEHLAPGMGAELRYLHRPGRGLSLARNIGLRAATSDIVVLLDDDMLVEPAWLVTLLGGLGDGYPLAVATGRVLAAPDEEGHGTIAAALVTTSTPDVYRGRQPRDVVPGANVALRRQLVLDLGGFDERLGAGSRFRAADDNDMGLRLLDAGCEVRHIPDAVVFHRGWRSRGELVRLSWAYGRGKGAFYAKHVSRTDRYIVSRIRADLRRRLARALRHLVRSPATTANDLVYVAGALSGGLEWVLRGHRRRGGFTHPGGS